MLLTARDEDGNGLSHEDIQAEVDTFLFEGSPPVVFNFWCFVLWGSPCLLRILQWTLARFMVCSLRDAWSQILGDFRQSFHFRRVFFTQDAEHLATCACKLWDTLLSMGVFTQVASNIKGFACKSAYTSLRDSKTSVACRISQASSSFKLRPVPSNRRSGLPGLLDQKWKRIRQFCMKR